MVRTASISWLTKPPEKSGQLDDFANVVQAPSFEAGLRRTASHIVLDAGSTKARTSGVILSFKVLLTLAPLAAFTYWLLARDDFRTPHNLSCEPFSRPGALFLNIENASDTRWQTFDASCPSSHLLPVVQLIIENEAINVQRALPWLANRTVVLIGDSIERFSTDYFCDLLGGELSIIDLSHPYSPPPYRNGRDELHENEEVIKTWVADGRPHWCKIDRHGLNLNLITFFMYGAAKYDEFVQQSSVFKRPHYFAPVETDRRIDHWVKGTLEKAKLNKPDIVQFSSCLWDLMHWSEIDSLTAGSQDVVHAPFATMDRLNWYQTRLRAVLDKIESSFPKSTLVWRRGHDVTCGQFHVPCARNAQFNNVANHEIALRKDRWAVDETGFMIRGHSDFYKDRVHPGEAFRGLWADVMLYRLRETYLAQQNIDRSSIPPHGLRNDPST